MPIETWVIPCSGLYLLAFHLPLLPLFLAPLLVLAATISAARTRRVLAISAIALLVLGMGWLYAALESGPVIALPASEREIRRLAVMRPEFIALARSSFTTSILVFTACLLICRALRIKLYELSAFLPASAIALYLLGLLWIVNTVH